MAYRRKSYTYWDGDAIFPIPFEYLEQDDILVFINDEPTTDFVIENTQVKLNNIPTEVPAIIKIVSATDIDKAIVDWENVSSLDEDNLILSDNQIRYAVQELYDNTEQFKVDINNTLSEVNEAARLISTTIETVDNAVTTTQEQAIIATEQANIATQQSELVASTANKALEDIDTLRTNTLNELDTIVEDSVETVSGLANEITHRAQNIINRLGINLFDTKTSDHILSFEESEGLALLGTYVYKTAVAGSRYGYPDFYEKCLQEKELGEATETTFGESTITIYTNVNGHQFYHIADKAVIDTLFEQRGEAMFYGVDEENERIFLPRRTRTQATLNPDEVNAFIEAGLPNITGTVAIQPDTGHKGTTGAFYVTNQKGASTNAQSGTANNLTGFDASRSNSTYGNSNTVQPACSLVLEYMVVGNAKTEKAQTEVIEITTSENDTLPLFHNFYSKEDMTTTGAYVNASLGSFLSGNVYATAYNELVKKLGSDNVKPITDSYTDYDFVVNQDDMTFRLPLLNGSESLIGSEDIEYERPSSASQEYIATANGLLEARITTDAADQRVRVVNVTTYEIDEARVAVSGANGFANVWVNKGDTFRITCNKTSTVQTVVLHKAKGNGNLYFKVANAVENLELLDVGKVMNEAVLKSSLGEVKVVTETYRNGWSWYRVWSDGWCEQGGYYDVGGHTIGTVSLLKPYKHSDYSLICVPAGATNNTATIKYQNFGTNLTNSTFQVQDWMGFRWVAKGYIR